MVRVAFGIVVLFVSGVAFASVTGLRIDYPKPGAIFPPDIAAPTVLWHDASPAGLWRIEIRFASGSPALRLESRGPVALLGPLDRDCISTTNRLPEADPRQHSWKPDPAQWKLIKRHSVSVPAILTLTGHSAGRRLSRASVEIRTSTDPVGAAIFYRDVPLMPSETATGAIKPLAPYAVRLVKWRLRNVSESNSRVVMQGLPMCANCHSFSQDGKFLGMDLDGLHNNKGQYFLKALSPEVEVGPADVIQWSSSKGRLQNAIRVGFMSQIAPDGGFVLTTVDTPGSRASNYYVANFTDYRFLQVFFPTRGMLAWYSRATGILRPLPGADDPAYVQFGGVWSPDGKSIVFARAPACDPNPPGLKPARFANDPNELPIRYDLYRIPFNNGRGGRAEPIAGASANGKSNTFPKLSPDGRWLVFVQSRNGQLMRPDSQLYIAAANGGVARRMRCNTSRMNSWHSFSPNGHWLVFSSKARSPYTQMYLTHVDAEGNDTPPVLVENATAANRAVNLPEFVTGPAADMRSLGGPALDYYRLFDRALYLQKERRYSESADVWKSLAGLAPDDVDIRRRLGVVLLLAGRRDEAVRELEHLKQMELRRTPLASAIHELEAGRDAPPITISPSPTAEENYYLALVSLHHSDRSAAILRLRRALNLRPDYAEAHQKLAETVTEGNEALEHWRAVIRLRPNNATALRRAAWILATNETLRNGPEAQALAVRALLLAPRRDWATLDTLAAACAENDRFEDAIANARAAIAADPSQATAIQRRIDQYQKRRPWRE